MRFETGTAPNTEYNKSLILETVPPRFLNRQSGIYLYKNQVFIVGPDVFLHYENLTTAKEEWFGCKEEELYATIKNKGKFLTDNNSDRARIYLYNDTYYVLYRDLPIILRCNTHMDITRHDSPIPVESIDWDDPFPVTITTTVRTGAPYELEMIQEDTFPEQLKKFTFPYYQDEEIVEHSDYALWDWIFEHGTVHTTYKSVGSTVSSEINIDLAYVILYEGSYYFLESFGSAIIGKFLYPEIAVYGSDYEYSYEGLHEIDYIGEYRLDRTPDDESLWTISDENLVNWMREHADYETTFYCRTAFWEFSLEVYAFLGGYFVIDPFEFEVRGKYKTYEYVLKQMEESGARQETD